MREAEGEKEKEERGGEQGEMRNREDSFLTDSTYCLCVAGTRV